MPNQLFLVATLIYGLLSIMAFYLVSPYCHFDYPYYIEQWQAFSQGDNPWRVSHNAYGIGHSLLGVFYYVDVNLPRYIFLVSWLGAVVVILRQFRSCNPPPILTYLLLAFFYFNPVLWASVSICANNDALVAALALFALALRTKQAYLGMLLLVLAGMIKLYPFALIPLYALARGKLNFSLVFSGFAVALLLLLVTYVVYGPLSLSPFTGAAARTPTPFSIYGSLAALLGDAALEIWGGISLSTPIVFAALVAIFCWCWWQAYDALTSCLLGCLVILIFYALSYQQHYLMLFLLFPYWFAVRVAPSGDYRRAWRVITPFMVLAALHILLRAQLFLEDFVDLPWTAVFYKFIGGCFFLINLWLLVAIMRRLPKLKPS